MSVTSSSRMRTFVRIAVWTIAGLVVLGGAGLGLSAYGYYHQIAIDPLRGIDESRYVRIGGIDQWIQIRGDDRRNPVLLWLNGGPGFSTIPYTFFVRGWERQFTVVMWDQRGEGKTFERSGPSVASTMTIDRMTQDGIEVALYLRARLHHERIILLGHSWGSILAVRMLKERPDLFAAYVGTGQVTNFAQAAKAAYPLILARARVLRNRSAEEQLVSAGAPPYDDVQKNFVWLIWGNALDPGALKMPRSIGLPWALVHSYLASRSINAGLEFSQRLMLEPMLQQDLTALGYSFPVPVIFIEGSGDALTVTALIKAYFDRLSAPEKVFVTVPGYGHDAILRDSDGFLAALVRYVRPIVAGAQPTLGTAQKRPPEI